MEVCKDEKQECDLLPFVAFKSYTRKLDLDPIGEEIFLEALDELVSECRADYKWRIRNAEYLSNLHQNQDDKVINQKGKKNGSKARRVKP